MNVSQVRSDFGLGDFYVRGCREGDGPSNYSCNSIAAYTTHVESVALIERRKA